MNKQNPAVIFFLNRKIQMGILPVIGSFTFSAGASDSQPGKPEDKPNIVILFADDLGYGDLGCFGHPTINTPNLDRMAQEGMKMTQFYVGAPVCSPSRGALITGRLPVRTGLYGNPSGVFFPNDKNGIPEEEITIAEAVKKAGYATACYGKWHLGHLPEFLPVNHGFDEYFGIPYSNDMYTKSPGSDKYDVPPPLMEGTKVLRHVSIEDQEELTRMYTERAVNFIEENRNRPFLLYVPYTYPHVPLFVSERFRGRSARGLYGDVVGKLDWSVGEIMQALHRHGIEENTLVIFTSDNGPWLMKKEEGGSAGLLYEGKNTCYEGGMRVPAIAWWPGTIAPGQVSVALATTMDIMATAVDLAGIDLPENHVLDGFSLEPLFTGKKENVREYVPYYRRGSLYAYRKGPWKIQFITYDDPYSLNQRVVYHQRPMLFNLDVDPSEKYNLHYEKPELVRKLEEEAVKYKESIEIHPPLIR